MHASALTDSHEANGVMQVVPGELTIITGVPNSGKSEWIDALMVNLADKFGWRFGLCSMEKKVGCNLLCMHAWMAADVNAQPWQACSG